MTVVAGISATKTGFELVKGVVEKLRRPDIDVNDVQARLLELQGLMLEAREALSDAQDEIAVLKQTIAGHDDSKAVEADMQFEQDGGFLFRKSERAAGIFNPHCPVCWGLSRKAVPMKPMARGSFKCVPHDAIYTNKAYQEQQLEANPTMSRRPATVRSPYLD